MSETNLRKCKKCLQLKQRTLDGSFDGVNKRWRDESGTLWNGSTCPACHKLAAKELAAKRRHKNSLFGLLD